MLLYICNNFQFKDGDGKMNKIVDNKKYLLAGDVIKDNIQDGAKLSIAAAYFTLYAFEELKEVK